jgi:hypothetical protein
VVGFADEVWWSRLARPTMRAWQGPEQPVRLCEPVRTTNDRDPAALACYGVLLRSPALAPATSDQLLLQFVDGRPVSAVTIAVLERWSAQLQRAGKTALLLIWDNAPWHISRQVRTWLRQHNLAVKRGAAGVRIIVRLLPVKSPWLNPIEPKWVHGKRAIVALSRMLTPQELADRVCHYYQCPHEPHVVQPQKAA